MSRLGAQIEAFKYDLWADTSVVDPPGVHHELHGGMHGQKVNFDALRTGKDLYQHWIAINAAYIRAAYIDTSEKPPTAIVGVANGANRLALHVAKRLEGIAGLRSEKAPETGRLYLPSETQNYIADHRGLVVVLEDVGTTGDSAAQVAQAVKKLGSHADVLITFQRRIALEKLVEADVPHRAIVSQPLPTYTPEECLAVGFCAQGAELIPRD